MCILQRLHVFFSSKVTGLILAFCFSSLLLWVTAVTLAKPAAPTFTLSLTDPFPTLTFSSPVDIAHAGDSRLFIVEQRGQIKVVSLTQTNPEAKVFLNIEGNVTRGGEMGLLGLAFHPNYAQNGYFYVNYTHRETDNSPLFTYVSRFQVSGDPDAANPNSEEIVLRVQQPYENHNAGDLAFGADGYLYVGLGDGGSGGDPLNHGQTESTLLGSLLRLDVDGGGSSPDCGIGDTHYTIPADNPFVADNDSKCNEIWATGLRNPWRFSFDRQTDEMFIGDVGQNAWEEIDYQPAATSGQNYGWRCYEGNHEYNTNGCNPDTSVYTFPVAEYYQDNGRCAVTGGFVYRGSWHPAMNGSYFYGDYCSGDIWSLQKTGSGIFEKTHHLNTSYLISTFGEDAYGEIYLADRGSGHIYRLQDDNEVAYLSIEKEAPLTAVAGDPFTYTLTIQNRGSFTMTNVTVTDTVPSHATYQSGGTLTGDTVSWPSFTLAPYSQASVQFTVTSTQSVINNDYRAAADEGYEATGTAVVTLIGPIWHTYLPTILKQN